MVTRQPDLAALGKELGHMQGEMTAVKDSLDRIEAMVERGFDKLENRLRALEDKENQRKGALALLMVISGMIGGVLVKVASALWGTH